MEEKFRGEEMQLTQKYSKLCSPNGDMIALFYFDDLYKATISVEINTKTFHVMDTVNYPSTNYSSLDEIINKVIEETGIPNPNVKAISISKDEFFGLLEESNLGSDFILKIKEKLPDEVIKLLRTYWKTRIYEYTGDDAIIEQHLFF